MKKLIVLLVSFMFTFVSQGPIMAQNAKAKKWDPKDAKKQNETPAVEAKKAGKAEPKTAVDPNKLKLNKERKMIKRQGHAPVA